MMNVVQKFCRKFSTCSYKKLVYEKRQKLEFNLIRLEYCWWKWHYFQFHTHHNLSYVCHIEFMQKAHLLWNTEYISSGRRNCEIQYIIQLYASIKYKCKDICIKLTWPLLHLTNFWDKILLLCFLAAFF